MDELFVDSHALKHGLSEEEIRHAWDRLVAIRHRGSPYEGEIMAIGQGRDGSFIELVGARKAFGVLVYHAIKPPTKKALLELGLIRRQR